MFQGHNGINSITKMFAFIKIKMLKLLLINISLFLSVNFFVRVQLVSINYFPWRLFILLKRPAFYWR